MADHFFWAPDPGDDPSTLPYLFGGVDAVASLKPGTILDTWTFDCFGGKVRSTTDLASEQCDPRLLNPQTGPFHIEGARVGDTLAVHFLGITPRHAWGVSSTVPFFGALTATPQTAMLHDALAERTWIYELDVAGGLVHYAAADTAFTAALPLDPMHGTVGVAPALGEARSSLTAGAWGGNLDTPEMRAGATCYLGVNVDGALMSLGDGHARQGEGETCGVAVECAMDTSLVVDVVPGVHVPWPRIETDDHIMTVGCARPLEDAFRISQQQMVLWVAELTGQSLLDAYQLVSQVVLAPVANVVDGNYTMVAKLPKSVLGPVEPMGGMHRRLRALHN